MLHETIAAYAKKRSESAPLPTGSAPYTSSTFFKLQAQAENPRSKDWTHRLSMLGKNQSTSTLKEASKNATEAKLLSLGTARPAPEFYPWESMTMSLCTSDTTSRESQDQVTTTSCAKGESNFDLGTALNYGCAAGSPQMVRFITEHVEMIHNPPYQDWQTCLTCSTTSAIDILLRVHCDPGDCIVMEEYSYPGTIESAKRMGLNILSVAMDEEGLLPGDLDSKLCNWNSQSRKPSVLYTIPTGQNPTGVTQPTRRRRQIYTIAEEHDLLIIEDDPYHFIQLQESSNMLHGGGSSSRLDQYLKHLLPSYLSMDTSGRVLRLDTTSKILAPGLRCGWMTGCAQLVSKFVSMTELSMVAPSGPSQVMLYKLLDQTWGHEGTITWLDDLSARYRRRLQLMISACEEYLPTDICSWSVPDAGMFLWIQVDWSCHAIAMAKGDNGCRHPETLFEVEDSIYEACMQHGVQISKGSWFAPARISSPKLFFRITFAAAAESDVVEAVARFGRALHREFELSK